MPVVRHFRQILLWPLQLMPLAGSSQIQRHWERLGDTETPWFAVTDEFGDPAHFQLRHYGEFVSFLPAVQRFLYGEGGGGGYGASPIRVFRRQDVASVRARFKDRFAPVELTIAHVDLYFFYDIDVVIPTVEVYADDLDLEVAEELLFRFGRSYPASWDHQGRAAHCLEKVEWLDRDGQVLAATDYHDQGKYLSFVCRERAAAISADWEFLMAPLVLHASDKQGRLRFRQLEYDRMPVMAFLAVDDPLSLSRADFVRLTLATRSGQGLPFSARFLGDFERRYCYDRYWGVDDPQAANTRFLCSGHTFLMVGDAARPFFMDAELGLLGQFRHQYFLLGLIVHFHRAALLMFGDRLGSAVSRLDINDAESVKAFKRVIRQTFEIFLRFTHRCWFQEVSVQAQAKALFSMWRGHLGTEELYDGIRREVQDMAQYLDSDGIRRQANTVVRLTVVTTFGLIATITTGALGMNLLAAADDPLALRVLWFMLALAATTALTLYTIMVSKRLSDQMDILSDQRLPVRTRLTAFLGAWRLRRDRAKPPSS